MQKKKRNEKVKKRNGNVRKYYEYNLAVTISNNNALLYSLKMKNNNQYTLGDSLRVEHIKCVHSRRAICICARVCKVRRNKFFF